MPEVNTDAKVFDTPFAFNVKVPQGATLYYTTDGSTPTLTNGKTTTTGRFSVGRTTMVYRFRLFQDGYLPSSVLTRSFIYKDKDYYMPIVSVVTDDDNLFDNKIGAYTVGSNGISGQGVSYSTNKNRSWERPVNFEYLVPDDDGGSFLMALNQECDFEVCGGWSRNQFAPNASFRLKGGKYYLGQNFLPYSFFQGKPFIKSKGVVVRNGGNDGYGRIRDAGTHQIILTSGFYVDCQEWQPVHVFINGQFYFTYNLREPNNKNHAYGNYGIDDDELDQFEINGSRGYEQRTGDNKVFRQWMSLATRLGNTPANTALYDEICELVDIDEYCNYMAAECYVGCGDWLTNSNNVKGYRDRNDGRFHLVFMDLDSGFGSTNMLSNLSGALNDSRYDTGRNFLIDIFLNMLKHQPFKKRFIDAFCLVNGSVFEEERSKQIVNAMRDYMMTASDFEGNGGTLRSSANTLINGINNNRTSRMNNFRNYFGLKNPITLELESNVKGAMILVNGQEVPTGRFRGTLQAPMKLTALGPAGYRFAGWQKSGEGTMIFDSKLFDINDTWFYYDQGSLHGTNWKDLSYSTSAWKSGQAPFGYGNIGINGSADYATTIDYGSDPNNKRPTYYFRKVFRLAEVPTATDAYVLKGYVDDGCVVYVNGHEIGRHLMADGETTYEQYSTSYASSTALECSFVIDNQWLRSGRNVIAVEVHNTHGQSSDIYWTAELIHNVRGEDALLSTDPELELDAYAGSDLGKIVATYEALPDAELLAAAAAPIKVNEVSAGNSIFVNDHFKKNDWIELYNTTDTDLNIAGLYLSDDTEVPQKYQIPAATVANTIIPARGHLVVWADKLLPAEPSAFATPQLHTGFKLGNREGEVVLLTSSEDFVRANAAFFQEHPTLATFADLFTYTTHTDKQSVGRYPDGGLNFYCMNRPSIGRPNARCTPDCLIGQDGGYDTGAQDVASAAFTPSAAVTGYYTIVGLFLGRDLQALPAGLYIIRYSDGTSRKVMR